MKPYKFLARRPLAEDCEVVLLSSEALLELKEKAVKKIRKRVLGSCVNSNRRMVLVMLPKKETSYWADVVTGQLYRTDTGECLSGRLWLEGEKK